MSDLPTVGIRFFPNLTRSQNPYWQILRLGLEARGFRFVASDALEFGRRWLYRYRREIDVLHFHYIQQFYAYEGTRARLVWVARFARNLLIARHLGYRTAFTLHNLHPTYSLAPSWVDYLGHWVAANLTDSVIVHCAAARRALARRFGRRRNVFVIDHPHYIDAYPNTLSREEARSRLGIALDRRVFLFFGGIRPNKGIETLVEAFQALPDPEALLLIAGKPWRPATYVEQLQAMAKADARIKIFAQFVEDEEIQVFMNAADAIVLPFKRILTSGSAFLALSFGVPLVAPEIGCLPELVTEGVGFVYAPDEPGALLEALKRCRSVDLAALRNRVRLRVEPFTAAWVAEQLIAAYQLPA
ncbi:MAG: glycosyltransferase [Anaerolineae bacterium]|nr:glycosyltransferase [Anaerolineae bacterium]